MALPTGFVGSSNFPDQIEGQDLMVSVNTAGGLVTLGGVQSFRATVQAPKRIVNDITRIKRYQRTGPVTVEWTCASFMIYQASLVDVFQLKSQQKYDYGNYDWNRLIFNISEQVAAIDQNGATVLAGGWQIVKAAINTYDLDLTDPNTILMQNVSGIAFGLIMQSWGGTLSNA